MSSSKIIAYKTICRVLPSELDDEINKLIQEGWELYHGPYSAGNGDRDEDGYSCQAMVKRNGS